MRKIYLLFFLFVFCGRVSFSQTPGEWTWMKGDSAGNSYGTFGVQGVPDSLNYPYSLYEAAHWTDLQGNFWLYGGMNFNSDYYYGDLWKYDPSSNIWTWMNGTAFPNPQIVNGTKGIPAPSNTPGGRAQGVLTWTDGNNDLWLFGGDATQWSGYIMNDLWKYSINSNMWTWMGGDSVWPYNGNYGAKGVQSPNNWPPNRANAATWIDQTNNLWLFGGFWDNGPWAIMNDIWKYDISANKWTWMNGDSLSSAHPNYGIKGISSPTNDPGARWVYSHWKDRLGNFWIFGGLRDFNDTNSTLNDLWKYEISTNNWTWISGANTQTDSGYYGNYCDTNSQNLLSSRLESKACWTDRCGNFWIYGGAHFMSGAGFGPSVRNLLDDFWKYDVAADKWTWINGHSTFDHPSVHGTMGVSSPTNTPGSRDGANGWVDNQGNFWMFGGCTQQSLGDLWRYVPDTLCGGCSEVQIEDFIGNNTLFSDEIKIYPNPASQSVTISWPSSISGNIDITVLNVLGEKIYSEAIDGQKEIINCKSFPSGIYFIKVVNEKVNFVGKFVKE